MQFVKQLVYFIQCTCKWVLWRGVYLDEFSIQCLNNCSQVDSTIIQHFNVQPGLACNLTVMVEGRSRGSYSLFILVLFMRMK